MEPDEYQHYADHPDEVEELFDRVMRRTVQRWLEYAKTKLDGSPVIIYNAPGNDDPPSVDEVLLAHGDDRVRFVEGEIIEMAPGMEMLSTGYTNVTPWDTHREYSEDADPRAPRGDDQQAGATRDRHLQHPRPAAQLPAGHRAAARPGPQGEDLGGRAGHRAGGLDRGPRGDRGRASRCSSLHGHIHESGGSVKIGRTTAINVGSEYGEGVLRGVLLTIGDGQAARATRP